MSIIQDQDGLTVEEVHALYFDDAKILTQPEPVYVVSDGEYRRYYTFDRETFQPEFYLSVTQFVREVLPMSKHLLEWYLKNGMVEANRILKERSTYGLILDILLAKYIMREKINLDTDIVPLIKEHTENNGIRVNEKEWETLFKKEVQSFHQFVIDYEVQPIASQLMLGSREYGLLGQIDFVCEMNEKKYTEKTPSAARKRVLALLDFKGGRHFHESHEFQLVCYREIWNANYPENQIEMIGNYSGSDWRKSVGYTFKDQSSTIFGELIEPYHHIATTKGMFNTKDSYLKVMTGVVEYGKIDEGNVKIHSLNEYVSTLMINRL